MGIRMFEQFMHMNGIVAHFKSIMESLKRCQIRKIRIRDRKIWGFVGEERVGGLHLQTQLKNDFAALQWKRSTRLPN